MAALGLKAAAAIASRWMPPHDARRPLRACRFRSGFPRPRAWLRLGLGAALWLGLAAGAAAQAQAPAEADARLLERGRSLAIAADCLACHTQAGGGKPYAGGYPINSPLGVIYASNITPSKTAGIATTARRILPARCARACARMARGCIRPCPTRPTH